MRLPRSTASLGSGSNAAGGARTSIRGGRRFGRPTRGRSFARLLPTRASPPRVCRKSETSSSPRRMAHVGGSEDGERYMCLNALEIPPRSGGLRNPPPPSPGRPWAMIGSGARLGARRARPCRRRRVTPTRDDFTASCSAASPRPSGPATRTPSLRSSPRTGSYDDVFYGEFRGRGAAGRDAARSLSRPRPRLPLGDARPGVRRPGRVRRATPSAIRRR